MSRFTLRLPETLHLQLEERAKRESVSLNHYLVYALICQVASDSTVVAFPPEAVRQQREHYEELLRSLRTATPAEIAQAMEERGQVAPEPDFDPALVERLHYRIGEAKAEYQTKGTGQLDQQRR